MGHSLHNTAFIQLTEILISPYGLYEPRWIKPLKRRSTEVSLKKNAYCWLHSQFNMPLV